MQYELGYKVITKDGRHSAIFGAYDHNSVVYNPLEEACPAEGCGPLALFCYPSYANRWKLDICMPEKLIIVKCIYIPSKKKSFGREMEILKHCYR